MNSWISAEEFEEEEERFVNINKASSLSLKRVGFATFVVSIVLRSLELSSSLFFISQQCITTILSKVM
ncbi:hypothetical protein L6164_009462 [Bauhinia variegata]|uniref:Uncharacterized protein n=1 Tax=Bauhinia variegata TaxID=167791 RepID=A0ACB9PJX8_BAUVA|nr:hypothetical protein L6164_009462 [Bauhinia variegata]